MTDKARLSNAAKRPEARAPGAEIRHAASVIIGLSGGVDSSVTALLLSRQGLALRAVFMKNWEEDDKDGHCSAAQDLADARAVSEQLGIPLTAVNFAAEYWERVFEQFLAELRAGRTPNPDVLCNREIKFKAFLDYALSLGAERIATGHYARVREAAAGFQLLKGVDPGKDQSYFLYLLGQQALSRTLFPLGELTKPQVRELAAQAGLATRAKKDSTGICFIGERDFKTFLAPYLKPRPGPIRSWDGEELGLHQGLVYYTLGQRQGLGIGGRQDGSGTPWYVVAKDLANDTLVVAQGHDHPALYSRALEAGQIHWIAGAPPSLPLRCHAKTRYRQADQACTLSAQGPDLLSVRFDSAQWAVTPGQSVVFYQDQVCLGGAIIERTSP